MSYLGEGDQKNSDRPLHHECSGLGTGRYGGTFEIGAKIDSPNTALGQAMHGYFLFKGVPQAIDHEVDYRVTLEATATCVDANANGEDGDTPGTTAGAAPPPAQAPGPADHPPIPRR